jgi:DNA polymerase-4
MEKLTKRIVFVSIPHIFAEAEEARQEHSDRSLVIVSGTLSKSLVIDHSKSLTGSPVKKGVFLRDIAYLKDRIRVLPADHEYIETLHQKVIQWLKNFSPSVESSVPGEYYLDLTGTRKLFGREIDTCGSIIHELKTAFGFTCRIGIGTTVLVAWLASQVAVLGGAYDICETSERLFLAPLSIELIPRASDETKKELVASYNIHSIGDLMLFSKNDLECIFGRKEGELLYNCSHGFSRNALVEKKTEKVLEKQLIVSSNTNDDWFLQRSFFFMIQDLCREMRQDHIFPRIFCLRVIYQDNYRYVMPGKLKNPSFFEKNLYGELAGYLNRALRRRTCIKKIILSFSHFIVPSLQLSLFHDAFLMERLAEVFDGVQSRYGKKYLRYGA